MTEEQINEKLKEEGNNKILIKKRTGEKLTRNRKKEFTETISFRLTPFLAKRLDRYVYQQLLFPTRRKGQIYRDIFAQFLKSKYIEYGFDWNDGELMETQNKTAEEQGK